MSNKPCRIQSFCGTILLRYLRNDKKIPASQMKAHYWCQQTMILHLHSSLQRGEYCQRGNNLILLSLVPFLTSFGVLALKMGSPTLDFSKYHAMPALQNVADKNGGSLEYSPRYIPTTMLSYFRPDALNISNEWPWIRFLYGPPSQGPLSGPWYNELKPVTYLPPLEEDSMWLERTTSITNTMPLALLATIVSGFTALRRRQWSTTLILLAGLSAPIVIFVQFAIAARYLADFYPVLTLGTIFAASLIPRFTKLRMSTRVALMSSISVILVFSIITVTMLGTQYSWLSQFGATG
jgi:hypothetical protein